MLSMSLGSSRFASTRARKDTMLKSSEPQNKTRSGEDVGVELVGGEQWRRRPSDKERTDAVRCHSMVPR